MRVLRVTSLSRAGRGRVCVAVFATGCGRRVCAAQHATHKYNTPHATYPNTRNGKRGVSQPTDAKDVPKAINAYQPPLYSGEHARGVSREELPFTSKMGVCVVRASRQAHGGRTANRNLTVFCVEVLKHYLYHKIGLMNFTDKQCGAVEACWAHNPEVVGSKPTTAIFLLKN